MEADWETRAEPRPRRRVLVGVDGSDTSWRAFAYAVGIARAQEAELLIAYVRPRPPPQFAAADAGPPTAHR